MSRRRPRDEAGALAVVTAICAVMMFSFAAIAVDLGNAMARHGDTQSEADLSALAAGSLLPGTKSATDPAVEAVADYFNQNQPQDDSGNACLQTSTCVTASELVDGSDDNGEVYFARNGEQMTVITPMATVQFGVAAAMGFNRTDVQAKATVQIGSPGAPLPFFLPVGCLNGSLYLKSNTPGGPNPSISYDPASGSGQVPKISSVSPNIFPGGTPGTVTITGSKPQHNFQASMVADFWNQSSGERVPSDTSQSVSVTVNSFASTADGKVTVALPTQVYNTPGVWQVRLKNSNGWSKTYQTFEIGDPAPPPTGCGVSSTGDFGFILSPRDGVNQNSLASKMNIALGIDHGLTKFLGTRPPQGKDSCNGNGASPYPGSVLDNDPTRDDANCVNIQTGMDTDTVTDGLIMGGSGYDGLLATDTTEGCDRNGGSSEKTRLGVSTNDDVLSCFIKDGVTVGQVTAQTLSAGAVHSIDERVFDSPRFGVVPIIDYPFNPQNGYYPILGFRPVFITDEPTTSSHGNSFASSSNGVDVSGGDSKVRAVKVIPINPQALPENAPNYDGSLSPWLGTGTKVVRLVD